jgi:hypothetical protein
MQFEKTYCSAKAQRRKENTVRLPFSLRLSAFAGRHLLTDLKPFHTVFREAFPHMMIEIDDIGLGSSRKSQA